MDRAELKLDLGLFAISACVLTLQVLQTKIFAFSLDAVTIYLAISICMLGLGASATLLALLPQASPDSVRTTSAVAAALGALAVLESHRVFALYAPRMAEGGLAVYTILIALALPYFCFGIVIALQLIARGTAIGRAYAFNLAGSALGCLIVFPLIDGLGAERALVAIAGMALGGALLLTARRAAVIALIATVGAFCIGAFVWAPDLIEFPPETKGHASVFANAAGRLAQRYPKEKFEVNHLYKRWDRTARVDVYRLITTAESFQSRPMDSLLYVQDSTAGSVLLGVPRDPERGRAFFEGTVYGAGYALGRKQKSVLIVGLGGGPDVLAALYHDAGRVVGVEINEAAIATVRDRFAKYLGHPYADERVEIHQLDGRTFLRSTSELFDLIQLSGVDTKSVLATGSLSVNENYLHTREAMGEILRHLQPNGLFVVSRFGDGNIHRLTSIALAGLRDLGVSRPEDHLVAIKQGIWRVLLVRRTPFPKSELAALRNFVEGADAIAAQIFIPPYRWYGIPIGRPMELMYVPGPELASLEKTPYFEALAAGRIDAFVAEQEVVDLRPPTDDRPYFFLNVLPLPALTSLLFGEPADPKGIAAIRLIHGMAGQLGLVSALFILAPLVVLRSRGLRGTRAPSALGYFACLGAGFMFIEIGLIQRFVLLLGHQTYAISIVLLGLLVGASVGSLLSSRLSIASRGPISALLGGLILLVVCYAFGLPPLFDLVATASFGARLVVALVLLVGLGVLLGFPFPTAIRSLQASRIQIVAWGIGVNGFASVVGSILAVEIAMLAGLRSLLLLGALAYGLALLLAPVGRGEASASTPST